MITSFPKTTYPRELQRNYKALIDDIARTQEPLYLLSNNKPRAVILDINFFKNLVKKIEKLEEDRVLSIAREGNEEYQKGEARILKSLKNLF